MDKRSVQGYPMADLGSVQQKLSCVFETVVVEEPSPKRSQQSYKVVSTDKLRDEEHIIDSVASEKIDGTCTFIQMFDDKPWLWARLDRKPNKAADKRFRKFQLVHRAWQVASAETRGTEPTFEWDTESDFKDVPEHWIPALGVNVIDGIPQADDLGHIPGWVPVDTSSRQHLWHLTSVDLVNEVGLVIQPIPDDVDGMLEVVAKPLQDLCGTTLELIGTNVNGNPYKLGTKEQPFHLLVRHGSIGFRTSPPIQYDTLKQWFSDDPEGQVEGIVWHCSKGKLYKLHRHHLGLKWPVDNLKLLSVKVKVNVCAPDQQCNFQASSVFEKFSKHNGTVVGSLCDLALL